MPLHVSPGRSLALLGRRHYSGGDLAGPGVGLVACFQIQCTLHAVSPGRLLALLGCRHYSGGDLAGPEVGRDASLRT